MRGDGGRRGLSVVGFCRAEGALGEAAREDDSESVRKWAHRGRQRCRFVLSGSTVHVRMDRTIPFVDRAYWELGLTTAARSATLEATVASLFRGAESALDGGAQNHSSLDPDTAASETIGEKSFHSSPLLVVCAETWEYRRCARTQALPGDRALEIGSADGKTTAFLVQRCCASPHGGVVAVDKDAELLQCTEQRVDGEISAADLPGRFRAARADVLVDDCSELRHLWEQLHHDTDERATLPCAVDKSRRLLFVDINGNRDLGAVLEILRAAHALTPPPHLIGVKSVALAAELRRASPDAVRDAPAT